MASETHHAPSFQTDLPLGHDTKDSEDADTSLEHSGERIVHNESSGSPTTGSPFTLDHQQENLTEVADDGVQGLGPDMSALAGLSFAEDSAMDSTSLPQTSNPGRTSQSPDVSEAIESVESSMTGGFLDSIEHSPKSAITMTQLGGHDSWMDAAMGGPYWDIADRISPLEDAHRGTQVKFATQLRRLRRKLDDIMKNRTQWRYEAQRLEETRKYLHESLNPLVTAMKAEHKNIFPPSGGKPRKKKKKPQKFDTSSVSFAPEASGAHSESSLPKSERGTRTIEAEDTLLITDGRLFVSPDVSSLHEHYMNDYEKVIEIEKALKDVMHELNDQEYSLEKQLKEVTQTMHSTHFIGDLTQQLFDDLASAGLESSRNDQSNADMPPIVEEYLNRAGDVTVWLERLADMDHEFEEEKATRDFHRDQSDHPSTMDEADEKFKLAHLTAREEIQRELQQARTDSANLAEQCRIAGHDINDYRHTARSTQDDSVDLHHDMGLPRHDVLQDVRPTSLGIENWLEDIYSEN